MVLMMGYFISRRPLVKSGECMYSYFCENDAPVVVTAIEVLGMVTNWPNAVFFVKRKLQTMQIFNKKSDQALPYFYFLKIHTLI